MGHVTDFNQSSIDERLGGFNFLISFMIKSK